VGPTHTRNPTSSAWRPGAAEIGPKSPTRIPKTHQGLREHGWVEGKTIVVILKTAQYKSERLPELVAELVLLKVDVLVVATAEAALAAKHGTRAIPSSRSTLPIRWPSDSSPTLPGRRNVTGLSYLGTELVDKQTELSKEAVATLSGMAVLTNPANPTHSPRLRAAAVAAQRLGVKAEPIEARPRASSTKRSQGWRECGWRHPGADRSDVRRAAGRLAQLAAKSGVAAMYGFKSHVITGGLMSYGVDLLELFRRAATLRGQDLKGAKPWRLARGAADQVRAGHQPQDRQDARPDDPTSLFAAGGPS